MNVMLSFGETYAVTRAAKEGATFVVVFMKTVRTELTQFARREITEPARECFGQRRQSFYLDVEVR